MVTTNEAGKQCGNCSWKQISEGVPYCYHHTNLKAVHILVVEMTPVHKANPNNDCPHFEELKE